MCRRIARPNAGHLGTIRLRRIFGIGDASPNADDAWAAHLALKPAEEASSSRSQSAAAVPDVNTPSRTVRPPFRLFDPFPAGLLRFQPTASQRLPFVPPSPRSSIPESAYIVAQNRVRRLSENFRSSARGKSAAGQRNNPGMGLGASIEQRSPSQGMRHVQQAGM